LLSFGDEEEFEEPKTIPQKKLLSSHDALNDPSLSKEYAASPEVLAKERERLKQAEEKKEKLKEEIRAAEGQPKESESYEKFDERMKNMLLKKRKQMDDFKGITKEDLIDSEEDTPIIKTTGKKAVRGLIQKTRGADTKKEESESESSDEDILTEQQK
jgi:hypothetical protein